MVSKQTIQDSTIKNKQQIMEMGRGWFLELPNYNIKIPIAIELQKAHKKNRKIQFIQRCETRNVLEEVQTIIRTWKKKL